VVLMYIISLLDLITSFLERLIHPVSQKINYFVALLVGVMSIPIVCDVLSRLFFKKSIPGIIEIMEFMLVVIIFGALAYTQIKKSHIRITLLVQRFPQQVQTVIDVIIYTILLVLFPLMSWQMIQQVFKKVGTVSSSLHIPISIFIAIAALGTILLSLVFLIDLLRSASQVLKDGHWSWLLLALVVGLLVFFIPELINILSWEINNLILGTMGFCFLFLLMLLGMPVAFSMILVGLLGALIVSTKTAAFGILGFVPYNAAASFILTVVPMFVLMGELAFRSGISQGLFETAYKWLGRLPGGLAIASVAGCAGFAAVCGDSIATAITMGTVAYPEMKNKKYDPALATGCLAAGGTLGILIPPSVGFIFYAIVAEESIGKLFIAGIIPGIILTSLFMFYIYFVCRRNPAMGPPGEPSSMREKLLSLKGVISMVLLIVIILGGIVAGIFSPTEGGAIGAFGAFIIALVKRRLTWQKLKDALFNTTKITCMLIAILIGVGVLGFFLAATRLPLELATFVAGLNVGRYLIFLAIVILYIILGCIMNIIPIILLTLPAILPTVLSLGFDPIWFGVVTVILMQMGQITPPIGINIFALSSVVEDVPFEVIARGIIPFFVCMAIAVTVLVIFPEIALFLPNLLFN